jgi:transposase-like protein
VKETIGSPLERRARRRFSPDQILSYVSAFERSGLTVAAFARQHDLVYSVLLRWLQRRGRAPKRRGRPPKLREVALGSLLGTGRWAAEVVRPDGLTVRVAHDVPAGWLDLLLGGPC